MREDTLLNLYSPSERFWVDFMAGGKLGRKLNLWNYYRNYFNFFYQLTTNLFQYDGLPKQLAKEIEKRLFYFGRAGIVQHEGKLVAVNVCCNTPDVYGRPTKFSFSFVNGAPDPTYSRDIGKNAVLGINTYEMLPTVLQVEHYALMVAHCDTSMVNYLVNSRIEEILKVETEKEAETARAYYNKVYTGDPSALVDKLEEIEINRNTGGRTSGMDILEIKDRAIKDFYNMFGINRFEEKKERVVTDEVNANAGMLRLNLEDMLEQRENMCEDIEKLFGLPCSVSPLVDIDGDTALEGPAELTPEGGVEDV